MNVRGIPRLRRATLGSDELAIPVKRGRQDDPKRIHCLTLDIVVQVLVLSVRHSPDNHV